MIKGILTSIVFALIAIAFLTAATIESKLTGPYAAVARVEDPFILEPSAISIPGVIIIVPGSTATNTVLDQIQLQQTPAVNGTEYGFVIYPGPKGGDIANWSVVSGNTNVATNSTAQKIAYRTNGTTSATLYITNTGGFSGTVTVSDLSFTKQTNSVVISILGSDPGSAREAFTTAITSRMTGSNSMAVNGGLYTTQNHSTTNYVRNTNGWWTRGTNITAKLTGISPWNSFGGNTRAGTLITPQHAICAEHYAIPTNTVLRFVDATNGVITRTVTRQSRYDGTDLQILRLNTAVDTNKFTPAKVLPANWREYLPHTIQGIPALGLDQYERATITEGLWNSSITNSGLNSAFFAQPSTNASYYPYFAAKIGGDSGNPACLIAPDGTLIILTVWTGGNGGNGYAISESVSGLNSLIQQLDSQDGVTNSYPIQEYDLTPFNTY